MVGDHIKSIMSARGFEVVKQIRETQKNQVLVARKQGEKFLLKMAFSVAGIDNIGNEVLANRLVEQIKPKDLPLYIPTSRMVKTKDYCLGIFEFILGRAMADQDKLKIVHRPTEEEMDALFRIQQFYFNVKKEKLPSYFVEKSKRFTFENYQKKMNEYLAQPMGRLISSSEKARLIVNMKQVGYQRAFQHHDFVLWNMFRKGGNVVLVDAEFSRWGMRWYDLAYFFIQTYVYLQSPDYAKRCLKYFVARFERAYQGINIRREIMFPMNYRITANLNESLKDDKLGLLARELLEKILTNDFEKVVA